MVEETKEVVQSGLLGTLGINGKLFLAQLVNFGVVLFVMWKWVYTPLLKVMDERSQKIEKGLKDAESSAMLRKVAEEEKEKMIMEARRAAKVIIEEAEATANHDREVSIKKTKQDVEQIVLRGKEQMHSEKDAMLHEVKSEIVSLVIAATEKVLAEKIDAKKDEKIIHAAVQGVVKG